jgi:hypothetical protein
MHAKRSKMSQDIKVFLIKFFAAAALSPLVGFATLQIIDNVQKAKKLTGKKSFLLLSSQDF